MDVHEQKRVLRAALRSTRDALPAELRSQWSAALCERALALSAFERAACIHVFCSFGSEPNTAPIIDAALRSGKRVVVPVTPERGRSELLHVEIFAGQPYRLGRYGIPIPDFPNTIDYPYCTPSDFFNSSDCIFVPLLAFDKTCARMGYGRGFYDRFLQSTNGSTIGLAFSVQEVERVPVESHDTRIDMVVTERAIYSAQA